MTNLALYASHYRRLGLPVTRISNILNEHNFYQKNLLKTPDHAWQQLFIQPQSATEYEQFSWEDATGVGTVTGHNSLLVIDIDGCTDYKLLNKTLEELELPTSYEWVMTSGSGSGFHIFVYADKFSVKPNTQKEGIDEHVVTTFMPNEGYLQRFDKMEFLWKTHVVLPPSLHHTGNRYEFLNCRLPRALPQRIKQAGLYNLVRKHCEAEFVDGMNGYRENEFEIVNPKVPSDLTEWTTADVEGYEVFCVVCIRTENDIPLTNDANPKQIAWVIMDASGKVYSRKSYLLNLDNISLLSSPSDDLVIALELVGQNSMTVLKELNKDLRVCTALVSFDIEPVLHFLRYSIDKHFLHQYLPQKRLICLKNLSVKKNGWNYEKHVQTLADLYQNFFNYDVHQIPDAESDALIMAKCLRFLLKSREVNKDSSSIYYNEYSDDRNW